MRAKFRTSISLQYLYIILSVQNDIPFQLSQFFQYKTEIVWKRVFVMLYLHLSLAYALYLIITGRSMFRTFLLGMAFNRPDF